jgi:hypothetical protein
VFANHAPEKLAATTRTQLSRQGAKVAKDDTGVRRYRKRRPTTDLSDKGALAGALFLSA